MHYDENYRETVTLRNGAELTFRRIFPGDKAQLAAAFGRLSAESRRQRFFSTKTALSERELAFLTEVDGINHFALVALREGSEDNPPEGVAVARFVRDEDAPDVAEVALAVVDDWQQLGVGKRLLSRLVAAAAERGVKHVRAITQHDNAKMRALIAPYASKVQSCGDAGMLQFTLDVSAPHEEETVEALLGILRLAGLGALLAPIWLGRISLSRFLKARDEEE